VLRFGKHRGERFDAVPADYLEWIVNGQNELSEDVKASAQYWLGKACFQRRWPWATDGRVTSKGPGQESGRGPVPREPEERQARTRAPGTRRPPLHGKRRT
jgi:hypothetical protein